MRAGREEGYDATTSLAGHVTADTQSKEEEEEEAPTAVHLEVRVFVYSHTFKG